MTLTLAATSSTLTSQNTCLVSSLIQQIHLLAQLNKQFIHRYNCDYVVVSYQKDRNHKMTVCLEPHLISLLSENQAGKTTYVLNFGKATFSINGQEVPMIRIHLLTTRFKQALDALDTHQAEIYGQRKGTNRLVSVRVD